MSFGVDEERKGRTWFFRLASIVAIAALFVAIGIAVSKGNTFAASLLIFAAVGAAVFVSWSWTGALFTSLAGAKRYVEGVEGDHRHEWHSFKGVRVRVFLDEKQRPWFPLKEIVFILAIEDEEQAFRRYGPDELAVPEPASEKCLSEAGLRHLVRYSKHPDARALGLWLERDVLRMLKNRAEAGVA